MVNENYLYFAESVVETGIGGVTPPEALLVPASSYLGADPLSTTTTKLFFAPIDGADGRRQKVTLTHATTANGGGYKAIVDAMADITNNSRPSNGGFIVVADSETGTATTKSSVYNPLMQNAGVTTVSIATDRSHRDLAVSGTTYGAGVIGTGVAGPTMRRWTENGHIITELLIDLTGLQAANDVDDVIGLAAGGAAYLYRNVEADGGIIYKINMTCTEAPAGTNNVNDIDLLCNSNAARAYDFDASGMTDILIAGGAWVKGSSLSTTLHTVPAAISAANDYFYLTVGALGGGGSAVAYTGGQFVLRFYGMPAF